MKRSVLVATAALVAVLVAASAAPAAPARRQAAVPVRGQVEADRQRVRDDHGAERQSPRAPLAARAEPGADVRDRREDRVPEVEQGQAHAGRDRRHRRSTTRCSSTSAPTAAPRSTRSRATPAKLVGDHGPTVNPPRLPLYLFRGTFVSAGRREGHDRRQGRQPARAAPADRPGRAADVHVRRRAPSSSTGITGSRPWSTPSTLKPGDRIIVRVRAPQGSTLAQVEATPARRVADREPKGQEANQNAQS